MTACEAGAASEPVLTENQLKRLARHRYSAVGQSLLEPYMQVYHSCMYPLKIV